MSVIGTIFEGYQERMLRVKANLNMDLEKSALMSGFEKELSLSEEQSERLEQLFYEICGDYQQMAFSDGFKTAFDLMFEVECGYE